MQGIMNLRCPTCGKALLVRRDGERRVLKTRILIFNNGSCFSKCPFCKSEVAVPIKLEDAVDKRERKESARAERLQPSGSEVCQAQQISLEQLLCNLEKPVAPLAAYVQTMLSNGAKRSRPSEVEKLNECTVQVRRLGDLMERYLGKCKLDAADGDGSRLDRRQLGVVREEAATLLQKALHVEVANAPLEVCGTPDEKGTRERNERHKS